MNPAAESIKARLSMRMVAERYGLEPGRSGYIACPFHAEHTPSLKVYDRPGQGFYCFGCGAGGDVIRFVMRLFRITFPQAMVRLNTDFDLQVLGQSADARSIRRWQQEQAARKQAAELRSAKVQALLAEHCRLWERARFCPVWSDEWCDALYRLSDIEYYLEVL